MAAREVRIQTMRTRVPGEQKQAPPSQQATTKASSLESPIGSPSARADRCSIGSASVLPAGLAPLFLDAEQAAAYVGVSATLFLWEVKQGLWPPGVRRGERGRRLTWFRHDLDAAAIRLARPPAVGTDAEHNQGSPAALPPEDQAIVEKIRRAQTSNGRQHRHTKAP